MAITDAQVDEMVSDLRVAFGLPPFDKSTDDQAMEMVERSGIFVGFTDKEMREEVLKIVQDAARYRWLRGDEGPTSVRWSRWEVKHLNGGWNSVQEGGMDVAIDAAMQADETARRATKSL